MPGVSHDLPATDSGPPVGVVLAGGGSRRMGRDKGRLDWRGKPLWRHAYDRLTAVVDEILVADGGRGIAADCESVADGPGAGPAAGILGAATARPGRDLLVLACDLPLVEVRFLRRLIDVDEGIEADWIVPTRVRNGAPRLEPLCSLFRPSALRALARRVDAGRLDLYSLVDEIRVHRLEVEDQSFLNVNRPDDLVRAIELSREEEPEA